tara:strand:+ start:88 stop:282 length:195 start_codon:yes stop_codon:yes gene_type:complete
MKAQALLIVALNVLQIVLVLKAPGLYLILAYGIPVSIITYLYFTKYSGSVKRSSRPKKYLPPKV